MNQDNATLVLTRFMAALAIPVTRQSISDELEKNADYNSLLAYSDVLDRWQVPNLAYNLEFEQLANVPTPFIAHLNNKKFGLVISLDEKQAVVSNEKWNNKVVSAEEFKKLYSGTILLAEKEERSGEADYDKKRRKELLNDLRMPVFFTGAAILLIGFLLLQTNFIGTLNISVALLTLFKTAGLATAILLLIQSMDANNPLIQKLCGDDNKNCSAILTSKAAKVTEELSWSETGFFYFAGTWLVLLFNSGHTPLIQALALLNIISLPYTFYSIYYQWRVAKQWCIFCCTVQALLWLEFFAFLPYLTQPLQLPNTAEWGSLITGMLAPILTWILVKPYLLQSKQLKPLKQQLRNFKYNTELFEKMLQTEPQYILPAAEHTVIIGNPEAEKVITMVANPYCQPCAKAHKALEWMDNREDVKLQVIFSTSDREDDKKAEVAAHLLAIQNSHSGTTVRKAMHDWYEQKQKNYEDWAKIYPAKKIDVGAQLQTQRDWCKLAEITGTPTLFINGRRLPQNYQPEDLKYFI
jgi:protein-disulfide isomerase/uncharacterized membrane protein